MQNSQQQHFASASWKRAQEKKISNPRKGNYVVGRNLQVNKYIYNNQISTMAKQVQEAISGIREKGEIKDDWIEEWDSKWLYGKDGFPVKS